MAGRWGLSDRELSFCRFVVASANATQAAIKAGYSPRGASVQASRMMKRDAIRNEIARLRQAATEAVSGLLIPSLADGNAPDGVNPAEPKALLDRNWTLGQLLRNLRICMGDEPVTVTRARKRTDGGFRYTDEKIRKPDASAANRAAELLLKHLPAKTEEIGAATDSVDPAVLAVMQGFRGVAERFQARLDAAAKAKRQAIDIDPEPPADG